METMDYISPMDRDYFAEIDALNSSIAPQAVYDSKPEQPLIRISDLGQTISEGPRLGNLLTQEVAAIKRGVRSIELQTVPEGAGAPPNMGGAESYGKEMREDIKRLAEINNVKITSVHAPPQIGNLTGLTQSGFNDAEKEREVTEIKKAIDFAADVNAGAVVVHTGEFPRPISEAEWNKRGKWKDAFAQYEEEPKKAASYLVNTQTGQIVSGVAKDIKVYEPVYKMTKEGKYIDINGNPTDNVENAVPLLITEKDVGKKIDVHNGHKMEITPDMVGRFLVAPRDWGYFEKQANEWNKTHSDQKKTPEDMFIKARYESQINESKGWADYYKREYGDLLDRRKKIKDQIQLLEDLKKRGKNKEVVDAFLHTMIGGDSSGMLPPEKVNKIDFLKKELKHIDENLKQIHESSTSAEVRAAQLKEDLNHIAPMAKYAKERSAESYAELGIYAYKDTVEKNKKKPVYIVPEHIFPNMGYGSHPEELIELVQNARKKMTEMLIDKNSPYYQPGMDKREAEELSKRHIKATLDTQHIGMWYRYFKPKPGETEDHRKQRFKEWYLDMIKKMDKAEIIGNIHMVDGFGYGHTHLPVGQGMLPVKDAILYLKKHGYKGPINSEGYGEGPERMITVPWREFGANIYGISTPSARSWTSVQNSYFSQLQSPYFVFGSYAPSNDWTLWSQVPFE